MKLLFLVLSLFAGAAQAESSCTASSSNSDQTCSITCPTGQSAVCQNSTGSTAPTCECKVQ